MFLRDFAAYSPPYIVRQEDGLRWLAEAHSRHHPTIGADKFAKLIERFGCGPASLEQRGTFLRDFTHLQWNEMQIFAGAQGASLHQRMAFFSEALLPAIEGLYQDRAVDFSNWIHVTCTGYASPSLIQTWVGVHGLGEQVQCLHAYHMGCYAAFPALRMARGNLPCEVLHTELCTLHLDPTNHDPEQLVIQSLFADGVIRYRVCASEPELGYEVVDMREKVAPNTLRHMTWDLSAQGFTMSLGREVPNLVQQGVVDLVSPWRLPNAVYAIHPGGPRIIDSVASALGLSEEQVHFSRQVLRRHGNMSSATLPHVWRDMLGEIPPGTPVISMAFGPGLTLSASLMRKVGPA